jgi:hypothetical protein
MQTDAEQGASLDPTGRHELAADFFHAKTGTAASYFTVDLSPEERAPYYAAADAFLAAHLTPEPEPEWKRGTVARLSLVDDDLAPRVYRTGIGTWRAIDDSRSWTDADVEYVHEMVVIDPADVDVDALGGVYDQAQESADLAWTYADRDPYAGIKAVLAHLGLNR